MKEDEDSGVHIVLVGNKCDLDDSRKVTYDEGQELANEWRCDFYETSAKTKINHIAPFYQCARLIRDARDTEHENPDSKKTAGNCCEGCILM